MRAGMKVMVLVGVLALSGVTYAQHEKAAQPIEKAAAQPAMDPAKKAAMEAMQKLGSPSEAHKALEPFVGNWSYTAQW